MTDSILRSLKAEAGVETADDLVGAIGPSVGRHMSILRSPMLIAMAVSRTRGRGRAGAPGCRAPNRREEKFSGTTEADLQVAVCVSDLPGTCRHNRPSLRRAQMKDSQVEELLYQALETELGGVEIYKTALRCATNTDLREEWKKYLEETENHVRIVKDVFAQLGLDESTETPGRSVVRHKGESLVKAMELALQSGDKVAAQLVAAECVVEAETKDHANWELIGEVAEEDKGDRKKVLSEAYEQVEEEEDEHLYHTMGWARELWMESLGMTAVLPPPEEQKKVKTAIGASRADQARDEMTSK